MVKAQVFNGTVKIGDKIAYATRGGSSLDMNIGTVTDILTRPHAWRDENIQVLKVRTTESTDIWGLPRKVTLTVIDRVVKLS